jgi:hypothetical protein
MARSRRDHASGQVDEPRPLQGAALATDLGQVEVVADQQRLSELDVVAQAAVGVREDARRTPAAAAVLIGCATAAGPCPS